MPVSSGKEEEAEAHSRSEERPQTRKEGGHRQMWVEKNPEGRTEFEGIEWHSRGWVERNPGKDQNSKDSRLRKEIRSTIENMNTQKIRICAEYSLEIQMIRTSKIEHQRRNLTSQDEQGIAQKQNTGSEIENNDII
jgi:hypothetical protein